MDKIIFLLSFTCISLLADTSDFMITNKYKVVKPIEKHFVNLHDTNKKFNEKEISKIIKDFKFITGETDENYKKQLQISSNDKNFISGINSIFLEKRQIQLTEDQKVFIPNYKEALEYFKNSCETKNNPHAAFVGLDILTNFNMMIPSKQSNPEITKDIIDKYMPIFSKTLQEKGYCYGYLYQVRYYSAYKNDFDRAVLTGDKGIEVCKKQLQEKKIQQWIDIAFRKEYVKAKTILELNNKK